jgi:hypothetical protein
LAKENSQLKEKVQKPEKNSDNSSIPPSRNRYPQKKQRQLDENGNPIKGKPGAKPGHKAHHRQKPKSVKKTDDGALMPSVGEIPEEKIDIMPKSTNCPSCGEEMKACPKRDHHDEQYELVPNPVIRKVYTFKAYACPQCGEIHYGVKPASLGTGLLGPALLSLLVYLKAVGHVSFTGLQRILAILGVLVCRGFISKCLDKASQALDKAYDELKEALPSQPALNIDETSAKENGKRIWTWVFRSPVFVFFAIKVDRAASVLVEFLGESFKGSIGCDFFSAYRKYIKKYGALAQWCLARLRRDIQFLVDHISDSKLSAYGQKLMGTLNEIFDKVKLWRRLKAPRAPDDPNDPALEGEARESESQKILEELRTLGERFKEEALDCPDIKKAKNIADRFREWPKNFYFTFLADEGLNAGVEPTNNSAEQSVKTVVIDRHVTQGTRSLKGRRRRERVWSIVATRALQGRSAFGFIKDAIMAHFCGKGDYPAFLKKEE